MKSIEKIYDEISPVSYDEDRLGIYSGSRKIVTEQLKRASSQPSRIADLAVGTGEFLKELVDRHPGAQAFGVDLSQNMLDRARTKSFRHLSARIRRGC